MRRRRPAEGERRSVTVLFADAVGSTPLAEKLGEEGMYAVMRDCLSRMTEAVHHYEGYVASFTGDGIMALFGAPIAHEDSARRAVAAAMRMQRALEQYAVQMTRRHGIQVRFRVGLNTGPVVVGTVTEDLQMDFTAIGDTVNLAARLQQVAEPGCVFISEPTHRIVGDHFDCEPLGELAVKGKAQPVAAWRVVRERPVRTRLEVAAERGLTRFVGRVQELAALEEFLKMARQGDGQVVLVSGEAGIGKSRLLFELHRRLPRQEVNWIEGHCISYLTNSPYLPVVNLLKNAFGIRDEDSDAAVISRVDQAVSGWEQSARGAAPYLKYVLSVDPGDDAVALMDPRERRVGVFEALRTFLLQLSARRPVLAVVEDLHWADEISQQALASLTEIVPSAPVLLVLTSRPGDSDLFAERAAVTHVVLRQLDNDESTALTEDLLPGASRPPELQRLITAKAEGNPFYLEEVTKTLLETDVLARTNGSYQLQRPIEDIHIPETIQEVILSRIDRLEAEAKRAIQLASVIGREFRIQLLDRISDLQARLSQLIVELAALEFIYQKALFPELAYIFKHALTHEVSYGTLLTDRRRVLHRLVGAAIEELYSDRLAEHYEILAHHYYQGQDWYKALDYLTKAGDKSASAYANQDALRFYARALEVCDKLGEAALPAAAALASKRGLLNYGIGDTATGVADFDRMVTIAQRLHDRGLEGTALSYRGFLQVYNHEISQAEVTLRAAWDVLGEGYEQVRPMATMALGHLLVVDNRLPELEPFLAFMDLVQMPDPFAEGMWNWSGALIEFWRGHFDKAVGMLENLSDDAARMVTNRLYNWWVRGMTLAARGDYEPALTWLHKALDMCERVGDWQVRPRVVKTIGWVFAELEDHQQALEWNQSGVQLAGTVDMPDAEIEMNARLNLGDNLVALGRPDAGEEQFALAEEVARNPKPDQQWLRWRWSMHCFASYGELWLDRGEPGKALAYAQKCLVTAEETSSSKYVARGRRLRGRVLLAQGHVHDAERELLAALSVATDLANPPQLWRAHAAIGDLRRAQGRAQDARRAYGEALSVIESVAAGLTDQELREMFLGSKAVATMRLAAGARA
jgi:class 3 adenylate cyclase/tetratricopeptide (TPR) repeat protein